MMIDASHEVEVAAKAMVDHTQRVFGAINPQRVLSLHLARELAEVALNAALNARNPVKFQPLKYPRVEPNHKVEA